MAKSIEQHAAEAQGTKSLEARLLDALTENAQMRAEMATLRQTVDQLAGRVGEKVAPIEPPTLVSEEYKKWAMLSAQEKSQLVADQRYGPSEGTRPFELQLVYQPRRVLNGVPEVPPSEWPRIKLHAHNEHEAKALYQELCGITGFSQEMSKLECRELAA